jgi:hypothetical protein
MRHFATESGKSKGQFYTPAEVSRLWQRSRHRAGADQRKLLSMTRPAEGSLLLKVGDEAGTPVTLYGQEKDAATSGLARMNMILHNNPTALNPAGQHADRSPSSATSASSRPSIMWLPIRHSVTSAGARASTQPTTRMSASRPLACRPPNRAIMPTCCISCAR